MRTIEVCKGDFVIPGTLEVLKNLEKLGALVIDEVRSFDKIEYYDYIEDSEIEVECFEVVIHRTENNPIDGFSKYDFIWRIIKGLGISISYEIVKE